MNRKREIRICKYCGKEIENRMNRHFCNMKCWNDYLQKKELISCEACGKKEMIRVNIKRKLCKECLEDSKYISIDRFIIFQRDDFKCVYCGRSSIEDGVGLQLEHVMPEYNKKGNRLLNVVTACQECNSLKCNGELRREVVDRIIERNKRLMRNYPQYLIDKMETCFNGYYKKHNKD